MYHMRIQYWCLAFCILVVGSAHAQKPDTSKYNLTFTPALFSSSYALQPGIELHLLPHWGFFTEVGIPFYKINDDFEKIKTLRINGEWRWYYNKYYDSYFSLQAGHNFRTYYTSQEGSYFGKLYDDSAYNYTSARIKSPVTTLAILFGGKLMTQRRFYLDLSLGAGVRFISTKYFAENVVRGIHYIPVDKMGWFIPDPAYECNCNLSRFQASLALRAGWKL